MLDDFKDNSFYKYANSLDKYYHAYLFEVDDIEESYKMILSFAKTIICPHHYKNNKKCDDCNICHLIDNNTYSDLKVIDAAGLSIKKEQILTLQKELSLKSSNNTNQVYIIKNAHKMNASASNSLLKFIEEPENGIYGILITNDRKQILETILSRCLLISLKTKKYIEYSEDDINNIVNFLNCVIKEKENYLPYLKQDFFTYYETRDDVLKAFSIMEVIIDSKICIKYQIKALLNPMICDIIKANLDEISIDNLIILLEKIVIYKNKLINCLNLNLNLFMERFLIDLSEVMK